MYEFIKGTLFDITPLYAVVEAHGVGYKLLIPVHLFGKVDKGSCVLFYTSFVVREHFQGLYGFLDKEERHLFDILITLPGIGPKTALNLIGHLSFADFERAIASENSKILSKVPGIGKKTAERLIVDLKGKFLKKGEGERSAGHRIADAVSALMHLGYNAHIAERAVATAASTLPPDVELSLLIATALKNH